MGATTSTLCTDAGDSTANDIRIPAGGASCDPVAGLCDNQHCSAMVIRANAVFDQTCEEPHGERKVRAELMSDFSFLGDAYVHAKATELEKPLCRPGALVPYYDLRAQFVKDFPEAYEPRPRPLGWGAHGEVFAARHRQTGVQRAIKRISKKRLQNYVEDVSGHILNEATILRRVRHPNIIRLYEVHETRENVLMVLELCEGGSLLDLMNERACSLAEAEASRYMWQLLSAVHHMHTRGVIHGDLKLENMVLCVDEEGSGNERQVKLIDFGAAQEDPRMTFGFDGEALMTMRGGTKKYLAPEVVQNQGKVPTLHADRVDVWALGVVMHVLLFARFPGRSQGSPLDDSDAALQNDHQQEQVGETIAQNTYVSESGLRLLQGLLAQQAATRLTALQAIQDPWLAAHALRDVAALHNAAAAWRTASRAFAAASRLQRLCLFAVAHQVAGKDAALVDASIRGLEFICEGRLARTSLWRLNNTAFAQDLHECFRNIDLDCSGELDWTKMLAVALIHETAPLGDVPAEPVSGLVSEDRWGGQAPCLRKEACVLAFNFLSCHSDEISASTLSALNRQFPSKDPLQSPQQKRGQGGLDYLEIMQELSHTGTISSAEFMGAMQGVDEDSLTRPRIPVFESQGHGRNINLITNDDDCEPLFRIDV